MEIIKVENLSKSFTYHKKKDGLKNATKNIFKREKLEKEAVKDISFSIQEGEIVGFLGANGAGKTTTLKMLSGILYPTSGTAEVLGYVPWERNNEFKKQFSIVMGQKNQLWWDLPASESFYLNKCLYELDDKKYRETLDELSTLLDVKELLNVQVRRLSLGERMKMELIASLIHRPKVLFLDEPTIGLDIIAQKKVREFLKKYNKESKTTIILTSHYMKDIEDLCERTILINKGRIVYDGSLKGMSNSISQKKVVKVEFENNIDLERVSNLGEVLDFDGKLLTLSIQKEDTKEVSLKLLNELEVSDISIEDVPIEESVAKFFNDNKGS